jgi:hypothetical protein
MRRDRKNRTLEVCIQRLQAGESLEQVLGTYPRWSAAFRPILQAVQAAWLYGEAIQTPAQMQSESRIEFLDAAGEMIPRRSASRGRSRSRWWLFLVILSSVALLLTWQLTRFSSNALPGDLVFPIKLWEEQLRIEIALDPAERLALEFSRDQRRVQEVKTLLHAGRSREVMFSDGLRQMEVEEWLVGDIPVLIPVDTRVVGDISSGYTVTVHGQTRADGVVLASQVQMRECSFEGRVEEIFVGRWIVDGVDVIVGQETSLRGEVDVGSTVLVIARRDLEGELNARLIEVQTR